LAAVGKRNVWGHAVRVDRSGLAALAIVDSFTCEFHLLPE